MAIPPEIFPKADDQRLITRIAQGEQAAFSLLYDKLRVPLYSLCFRMLGDAAEAEDALQEACVQIWRRASTYDAAQSSVFTWAVMITRSRVIDRLRARGRRLRVVPSNDDPNNPAEVEVASGMESASDKCARNDEAARVGTILASLPPEQRESIELAFFR